MDESEVPDRREDVQAVGPVPVRNVVSGQVGNVVQAGSVGDVYFNTLPMVDFRWQLPVSRLFVNRDAELDKLSHLVEQPRTASTPLVVVLSGIGGVGKTATGTQWARQQVEHFGDGHLYADVGALRHRGGAAVSDILGGFLRGLGVHEQLIPADMEGRAAMFRSKTAGRRILVLLDDVDQAAQVRPLLPASADSVVIVTSHRRLSKLVADGAVLIPVKPLTTEAGTWMVAAMLRDDRVDAERQAVEQLVRLCGGLPVALKVAGAQLAARRQWPVLRLVRQLNDGTRRLERLSSEGEVAVDGVCDLAYAGLSASARMLYRRVGLHPGATFGVEVAAVAVDLSVDDTDELLGGLCEDNLVEEIGQDRYRFHDLVRLHARRCADQDDTDGDRELVLRRIVEWYLLGAAAADVAVLGERLRLVQHDLSGWAIPFAGSSDALRWLDTERANLLGALREAAGRGWDDTVWQMCEALWAFYHSRKHYADWITAHQLGVTSARRCGNPAALARMHNQLARAYYELGEFDRAQHELQPAQHAAGEAGDRRIEAAVLESVGLVLAGQGNYDAAIRTFTRSWEINRDSANPRGMALQSYHRGQTLISANRYDEAISTLTDALITMDGPAHELVAARIRISLAQAYQALDRDAEAIEVVEPAVEITRRIGQLVKEAQALEILAGLVERTGDKAAARGHWQRVLDIRERTGDPRADPLRQRLAADRERPQQPPAP